VKLTKEDANFTIERAGYKDGLSHVSKPRKDGETWDGWGFRSSEKNKLSHVNTGRFPANFIHDGSEDVVRLFPEVKTGIKEEHHKRNFDGLQKNTYSGVWAKKAVGGFGDSGSASRFFYCAKASKRDRDEGCEALAEKSVMRYSERGQGELPQQTPSKPVPQRNHHPTVKPTTLMEYLCRLITPTGGTILDPFMGSGSTGKGAIYEGFKFIGIELEAEYFDIAHARIRFAAQRVGIREEEEQEAETLPAKLTTKQLPLF
jgi:site-specific DNA-methyltransferase (adenine-specific)